MQFNSGRGLPLQVNGVHGFCSSLAALQGDKARTRDLRRDRRLFRSANNDRPSSTLPE
jgi:hypothetical protein